MLTIPSLGLPMLDLPHSVQHRVGRRQRYVEGNVDGLSVEALPDAGTTGSFVSPALVGTLGLRVKPDTQGEVALADGSLVHSPGVVFVPWVFSSESRIYDLDCRILPGCIHDIILGSHFLTKTRTLTSFLHRVRSRVTETPRRLRLRLLGTEQQLLLGNLNGCPTAALPDTGSDIEVASVAYVSKLGLAVDTDKSKQVLVEYANGSTSWTSGIVRIVIWTAGGHKSVFDLYVLEGLQVDVILGKEYVFEMGVFSEESDFILESDMEELRDRLCNIRLIGLFGDTLDLLEEEYLKDCRFCRWGPANTPTDNSSTLADCFQRRKRPEGTSTARSDSR